jgi:hypothetical protein
MHTGTEAIVLLLGAAFAVALNWFLNERRK